MASTADFRIRAAAVACGPGSEPVSTDAKARGAGRFHFGHSHILDDRLARPGAAESDRLGDIARFAFEFCNDASVGRIAGKTRDAEACRDIAQACPIEHSLDKTRDNHALADWTTGVPGPSHGLYHRAEGSADTEGDRGSDGTDRKLAQPALPGVLTGQASQHRADD